jgi:hypothetical protein
MLMLRDFSMSSPWRALYSPARGRDKADLLTAWYSGWYNGLTKKHYMDITKGKEAEHEVIVYCKANPEIRIIQAIDIVFKNMRERMGIKGSE